MEFSERTLLEGALRRSKLILLGGMESTAHNVRAALAQLRGELTELDLRGSDGDPAAAIQAIAAGIETTDGRPRTALLLISSVPSPGLLRVLSALAGRPLDGDPTIALDESARVVVFAGSETTPHPIASLFPMRISGTMVLQDMRARAARADDELRAAQARARDSSRQHGIR